MQPLLTQFARRMPAITVLGLLCGLIASLLPVIIPGELRESHRAILRQLENRHPSCITLAEEHVRRHPDDCFGIALAAESAAALYRHELALKHYRQLPADQSQWEFLSAFGQASRHEVASRLSLAEKYYRQALQLNPHHKEAHSRLGHILQSSGRVWEAEPHFFQLIQMGVCRGDELLGMSMTDRFFRKDDRFEQAGLERNPPEPLMLLGVARRAIQQNQLSEAEQLLRQVTASRPELGEAQGRLGRILSDQGDSQAFEAWRCALPLAAQQHPEVLFSLGLQASRIHQDAAAARCYLEALTLSPNHLAANVQLASCLERLGHSTEAKQFAERGKVLAQLETNLNLIRFEISETILTNIVNANRKIGRYWETIGWCHIMQWAQIPQGFPKETYISTYPMVMNTPIANARSLNPCRLLDRASFPWPRWPREIPERFHQTPDLPGNGSWQLQEIAQQVGIDFHYEEGTTEETRMNHIFSTVGGGVGAIDYDVDGWCDLHLAQATPWESPRPASPPSDRLFRNSGAGHFHDITNRTGLIETGFSHGVTVGDYDQDGFPDLYISNMGKNRLFHNLGDGTFEDTSHSSGTEGSEHDWSISSVFADFSGDGHPDLYVLNYSDIPSTAAKRCLTKDGKTVACTPDVLISCPDRLFLSQGDGTFEDATASSQLTDPNGRGLGVIVWKYGSDNRLGLFIANDTTENYLFINTGTSPRGAPTFQEEAVLRGVAFDVDGNAQASMGVAAGDADHDGELDLFITNFFNESNTFYSRRADGFFSDLTRPRNLRDASFKMLGFGCQFTDLNTDGWPDLIATNGHVDRISSDGTMDRMPPQVFWNQQGRRYNEVPASQLGPFFSGKYLGRGMALLDWNRDGRQDIGITHLHSPFALLSHAKHQSPSEPPPLVIELIGTRSCRAPTGASIEIQAGEWRAHSLQTGGSGFIASNADQHHFFIPSGSTSVKAIVTWPDGSRETWDNLPTGCETALIQGTKIARVLRKIPSQ